MRKLFLIVFAVMLLSCLGIAQSASNTNLTVDVAPEAYISTTASTALTTTLNNNFQSYTSATPTTVTYKIRTSQATGSGSIVVKITTDFAAGGPQADTDLSYTVSSAGAGTAAAGVQAAKTGSTTDVMTFGVDEHADGDTATVNWTLLNKPSYKTGSYTAIAQFTISAT